MKVFAGRSEFPSETLFFFVTMPCSSVFSSFLDYKLAFLCVDSVFFRHLDSAGSFFSPDSHTPGFRPGTVAVEDRSASAQNGTQRSAAYKQLFFCSGLGTLTPPESVRVPFWHVFLSFPLSFSTSTLACWHPYCRLHVFCFRHGRRAPPP